MRLISGYCRFYMYCLIVIMCILVIDSYIKRHWVIVLKRKSGDLLNGWFWLNILSAKENLLMHIMR